MKWFQHCLFLSLLFTSFPSAAEFGFNTNLSSSDRKLILETLGLGILSKSLSQPNPLGTDSGLEIAFLTEMINTSQIKDFIEDVKNNNTLYYPKILIGKGLYERADVFLHFIPFTSTLGVSEFGGMFRFNFFQSENQRFYSSFILHANSANFNNQLTTRNVGADISVGLNWTHMAFFSGLGWGRSKGRFIGGTNGITDTLQNETESVQSLHSSMGILFRYKLTNFVLSWDQYEDAVYTAKIGVLF